MAHNTHTPLVASPEPIKRPCFLACTSTLLILTSCRAPSIPLPATADRILIQKRAHLLTLFHAGQPLRTYRIALGRGGPGPRLRAGDNRVPEGSYRIVAHNPHSAFHLALRIGYPTPDQLAQAHALGQDPGGDIMIHGIRNGLGWLGPLQRRADWTRGCIALTDPEMEELYRPVPNGTPIEIHP